MTDPTNAIERTSEQQLAAFISGAEVPPSIRETTRRYLLDWLGSAAAGGEMRPPTLVRELVGQLGGHAQATVLATGERTSAPLAAFANAAASHVLEMDDLDPGSIYHPAASTVAAALAVAEQLGADGEQLLDAIAVGYEVGIRVGEALGPSHYQFWHTTGTAGTFGAAAAAARLHCLSPEQTLSALGSAGTMTAGLWEFLVDGAMSKQLHPAKAAHDGIIAVLLGREGFTAAARILEGEKGLLQAMSREPAPERLTRGLSAEMTDWKVSGVSFKVHAACRHTHSAVDAALRMREAHSLDLRSIERVEVLIYSQALQLLAGVEPTAPYAAKFSLPFCVAVALVYGDLGPGRFSESTIHEEVTLDLASRVSFTTDPELDSVYPERWPSIVTIVLTNGERITERVDYPVGDIRAGVENEQLVEKFAQMVGPGPQATTVARQVLGAQPPLTAVEVVRAVRMGDIAIAPSSLRRGPLEPSRI